MGDYGFRVYLFIGITVMGNLYRKEILSWGRVIREKGLASSGSLKSGFLNSDMFNGQKLLPYGLGRSYGDSCLNSQGVILETKKLDKLLAFDRDNGLFTCEAGASLDDILMVIVPDGWFLPTTPGTKFITIGGAVANDVHGKNHHMAGSIGNNILSLEISRSDGRTIPCSREENKDLFFATLGGLGLTGLITKVTLQLKRINSSFLSVESIPFRNVEEFFQISEENDPHYEHTVSWIDCLAKGKELGRGIYMGGNFSKDQKRRKLSLHKPPLLSIPLDAPRVLLNPLNIKIFNSFYYQLQKAKRGKKIMHYAPFFYPLDILNGWNKLYGSKGFYQYQSVIPTHNAKEAIREMLQEVSLAKQGSFLAVIKSFGQIPSEGMLSFCRPGVTLALDFPNKAGLKKLFERLDDIVRSANGALYPAKDGRMRQEDFEQQYSRLDEFKEFVDPSFSSDFWRRMTLPK